MNDNLKIREAMSDKYEGVIKKAIDFATEAHGDQKRKYTGEPYMVHPIEVMQILYHYGVRSEEVLAAAVLHDVLEDTPVTAKALYLKFGEGIGNLVNQVTDVSTSHYGNRATRKAIDRDNLSYAAPNAQNIKLADLISNTKSIAEHDADFSRVYIPEKIATLRVLTKGNIYLYEEALHVAVGAAKLLGIDLS